MDYLVIEDGFGDDNVADDDDAGCVGVDTDDVDNEDVGGNDNGSGDEYFAEDCGGGGAPESCNVINMLRQECPPTSTSSDTVLDMIDVLNVS